MHECVGGLLVRDGDVLLGRRSDDRDWLPGAWDVFGGHVEAGENAQAALRRELREELGIEADAVCELGTLASAAGGWRLRLFAVERWRGKPTNCDPREHAEIRWVPVAEAQALLGGAHPDFAVMLAAAVNR